MSGHWWCQHCNQELSPRQVTFEENHDNCGGTAIWIEQEDIGEIEFLKRQLAEAGKQVDELQAQVALLRGALETVAEMGTYRNDGYASEDMLEEPWATVAANALASTPSEAAERVQKLVEVEKAAREYVSVSNLKMSISLQEEKLNKLVALSKALDAIETEA